MPRALSSTLPDSDGQVFVFHFPGVIQRVKCGVPNQILERPRSGHVLPKAIPGRPAVKGAVLQAHLQAQLEAHPDVTREEHCRLFHETYGIQVSSASLSRAQMRLG